MAVARNEGQLRHKYLRLSDLRRLEYLMFAPRRVVEGRYSGQYATRQRGQSVEFRDYREYFPGDDLGNVDWKVYGRSDRLFIKLFEHQSELNVQLLVDASGSMAYRGAVAGKANARESGQSKYDYACCLAASIAFLVMKQHDRFGFALARKGLQHFSPPQSTMQHLSGILRQMERFIPRDKAQLAKSIDELTRQGTRRSLLIVFSDLLDEPDDVAKGLAARAQFGGETILFHVLHPDELNLPKIEHGLFIDSETAARVRLNVDEIRDQYQQRLHTFLEMWAKRCLGLGVDYARAVMSEPYYRILERYLVGRTQRRA